MSADSSEAREGARAFDTHCHLDDPRYDGDRALVWQRAREHRVGFALVPAVSPARWGALCGLVRAHEGELFGALGIHPWALGAMSDAEVRDGLRALPDAIAREKGVVVAVGECGLDALIAERDGPSIERQERVFRAQCEVAAARGLPVVVHAVRAHERAAQVLRETKALGVLHSCSASAEQLRAYLDAGCSVSFAGSVTREHAPRVERAARYVPRERLLIESDGPDQAPRGAYASGEDGRRSEPAHVWLVARALAKVRGEDPEALVAYTTENARGVFLAGR